MDTSAIYQCFVSTLSPDSSVRINGERSLEQYSKSQGFTTSLVEIICKQDAEHSIRQAAAVYCKNHILTCWKSESKSNNLSDSSIVNHQHPYLISSQEKQIIREKIIPALISLDLNFQTYLAPAIEHITFLELFNEWSQLYDITLGMLHSSDIKVVNVGALCLLSIIKTVKGRGGPITINRIVFNSFDKLISIATDLVKQEDYFSNLVLWRILKIYKHATDMALVSQLRTELSLTSWVSMIITIFKRKLADFVYSSDEISREKIPNVKCKKWGHRILTQLFLKYCNYTNDINNSTQIIQSNISSEYNGFSTLFINQYASPIANAYIQLLFDWHTNQKWIPERSRCEMIMFLEKCYMIDSLRPTVDNERVFLFRAIILPCLQRIEETMAMFETEPAEYIYMKEDFFELEKDIRLVISVSSFLQTITTYGVPSSYIFIIEILTKNFEEPLTDENTSIWIGAFRTVCILSQTNSPKFQQSTPEFLSLALKSAVGALFSPVPLIRAEALAMIRAFPKNNPAFVDPKDYVNAIIKNVYCHDEPALQIMAIFTLRSLLQFSSVINALSQSISVIMTIMLNLSQLIDGDILTQTFEDFVETFRDDLKDVAPSLARKLLDQFIETSNSFDATDREDRIIEQTGYLNTMKTLMLSLEAYPQRIKELEPIFFPVIKFIFERRILDLYPDLIELIDDFILTSKTISNVLLNIFKLAYDSFLQHPSDLASDLIPFLHSFVFYGSSQLNAEPQYIGYLFDIVKSTFGLGLSWSAELISACSLIEILFLTSSGDAIYPYLQNIVLFFIQQLQANTLSTSLSVRIIEVVLSAIYYDARKTLSILESSNCLNSFIHYWFSLSPKFRKINDKKLSCLALVRITEASTNNGLTDQARVFLNQLTKDLGSLNVLKSSKYTKYINRYYFLLQVLTWI